MRVYLPATPSGLYQDQPKRPSQISCILRIKTDSSGCMISDHKGRLL